MGIQSVCVKTGLLVERAATDVGTLFSDCCARTAGEGAAHVYGASDASSFCDRSSAFVGIERTSS